MLVRLESLRHSYDGNLFQKADTELVGQDYNLPYRIVVELTAVFAGDFTRKYSPLWLTGYLDCVVVLNGSVRRRAVR